MRRNYIESAVGYVQVKRSGNECTVKCQICPEHRVKAKNYKVEMIVDEDTEVIQSVKCLDCSASEGGCKHALAFLMWVHQKSIEPAPTAVECYWKKPKLSGVGTTIPFITTSDFGLVEHVDNLDADNFLQEFCNEGKNAGAMCQLLKHLNSTLHQDAASLGLHRLLHSFRASGQNTYEEFLLYAETQMTDELCDNIAKETKRQSICDLWFELRYGRLTASKLYTAAHCKKTDGAFINSVIGASKIFQTEAMKRGMYLEDAVRKVVQKKIGKPIKQTGLILSKQYPELGASPDGIVDDCVVEIKCPSSSKSMDQYLLKNGNISCKCNAQIQFQMFLLQLKKGLFCVADPSFETNKIVTILEVQFDELFLTDILQKARQFWKSAIFDKLLKSAF